MASTGTTIQTEIDRLKKAKSDIKTAIINKGGTISDTATIDTYATAIDGISGGKKLKINVVTINPEHRFGNMYIVCNTIFLDNNILKMEWFYYDDSDTTLLSPMNLNGITNISVDVEPKNYTLDFEMFKKTFSSNFATMAIYKGDIFDESGEITDKFQNAIYGPDVSDIDSLSQLGKWNENCEELIYDGSTDCYTIVFDFSYKDIPDLPLSVNFSVKHVDYPEAVNPDTINKAILFKRYGDSNINTLNIIIDSNIHAYFNSYNYIQMQDGLSSLWIDIITYGTDEISTFKFDILWDAFAKNCIITHTYLNNVNDLNSSIIDGNFEFNAENHVITVSFTPPIDTTIVGGFVFGT